MARATGQSSLQTFATRPIAVQQGFADAAVANHFVAQVASDALRPVAPEDDFLLHVDNAEAARQAFQDVRQRSGSLNEVMGGQRGPLGYYASSAKPERNFRGRQMSPRKSLKSLCLNAPTQLVERAQRRNQFAGN